ncbi:MAG: glycoside hydrolase family 3 protein [Streptosporangiales bacterium]
MSSAMRRTLLVLLAVALAAVACTGPGTGSKASHGRSTRSTPDPTASPTPTATGWGPTTREVAEAKHRVGRMTLREKAGSLLMPQFGGHTATSRSSLNVDSFRVATITKAIKRYHLGGVIVMQQNVTDARQVQRLNAGLAAAGRKDAACLPLLIGVDQEGGSVARVREGATVFPSARTVGRAGDPALARLLARDSGEELRAMGFTLNFAPDADVGFSNSAIGDRSYAKKPHKAARMVTAAVEGYRRAGIVPVVKHFPGHGSAVGDSHATLAPVTRSRKRLERIDLVPFKAAVAHRVPVVLTGHLDVRAIDPGTPSSLSRKVVHGLLRQDVGFDGVAITDASTMEPVATYGAGDAAVRAVRAGEDIVLMPADVHAAYRGVIDAVHSGDLSRARVDRAATRVTALRLYAKRIGSNHPPWSVVHSAAHRADVRKVVRRAGG